MTHASIPAERRAALGLSDTLIRLSPGIEHADDLIADLIDGSDCCAVATLTVSRRAARSASKPIATGDGEAV